MEPTNALVPQDGRMSMMIDERDYDMRVSTLPASKGERLVIRFLDQGRVHKLGAAGFSLAALQTLRRMITRPSGLILLTGPTGSGKTSTLYGMLNELNRSSVNIITVENPVEYRLSGISQVEVNDKAGRSFSAALRSILRQDPDVVLIGEIRDSETAEIAIQAAMTGHLVLSTLHTNDAISSIPRLLGLGVQPSILADALVGVASQRLCRVLCTECKIPVAAPYTPEEKLFHKITHHYPADRPVGCQHCGFSGYKGRLPIVDILEINNRLRDAIAHSVSRISDLDQLREGDLKSMAASANRRIISGETTVAEALSAMSLKFWTELAEHYGVELDEDEINTCPRTLTSGNVAVLITKDIEFSLSIEQHLQLEGWQLLVASDSHSANEILRQEENAAFVIMDIADDTLLSQAEGELKDAARNLYWSRLPALVLLPKTLANHESTFRDNGMISPCLTKPFKMDELILHVLHGHAR
jgi:CheY-like chemotaxis protein